MTQTEPAKRTLSVRRTYAAPRDRVFAAWTDPKLLERWFAPEGMTTPEVDLDLRVGGRFRIVMVAPDGTRHVTVGTYREVRPEEKLVFTWQWEGQRDGMHAGETLVTVTFQPNDEGTEVVLTHEGFPSADAGASHEKGWTSIFARLDGVL